MRSKHEKHDEAVSPVVGVMLMLVVTIIIAAVVSGFAGGLAGGTQKSPQLTMDVTIKNTGIMTSSYILFDVKGVSEPIPTKDLKISTVWSANGTVGGNTVVAGSYYPIGFGAGVSDDLAQQLTSGSYPEEQQFGNYMLIPGTTMKSSGVDGMEALLGNDWSDLSAGDLVDVKITHIPSGKMILDISVGVQG